MDQKGYISFFTDLSERQIYAREFFGVTLLESIRRNFGMENVRIFCFDTENTFLSWIDRDGVFASSEVHPYLAFESQDVIGQFVYSEAVRDKLTYFDTDPRVYLSTGIIPADEYEESPTVRFLEENFQAHYCALMAMGINAYIRIIFLKTKEEGDFTEQEMRQLQLIFLQIAHAYKNFKKYEHARIISSIQNLMIESGEIGAYLVTDDYQHVISHNQLALTYLSDMFGNYISDQLKRSQPCAWLGKLIGDNAEQRAGSSFQTEIREYKIKSYTYEQSYTHGIVDRYHWIVISRLSREDLDNVQEENRKMIEQLTPTEKRVALLLVEGLTYQQIADTMVVSYHTVKTHVQNIFSKCGIKNRHQLYQIYRS